MSEINELIARNMTLAYQRGMIDALETITANVRKHIEVCNYEAVHEQECDVCAWAKSILNEELIPNA